MKLNKTFIWSFLLLILVAAVYRVIPARPWGFAPQIAMALFGGATIKDKKWAFALPIFSMFISDVLYQVLYNNGLSSVPGFYHGQFTNYILFAALTVIGFLIKKVTIPAVLLASIVAPTLYFLFSNFFTWLAGAGLSRPKTFAGLMQAFADGVPFYSGTLTGTLFFSLVLFGGFYLLTNRQAGQTNLARH